jgi:hypothetical protein
MSWEPQGDFGGPCAPESSRWPLDLLGSPREHFSRLQHMLGCGSELLADLLLVGEDVELCLDVLPHRLERNFGRLVERPGLLAQLFGTLPVICSPLPGEYFPGVCATCSPPERGDLGTLDQHRFLGGIEPCRCHRL